MFFRKLKSHPITLKRAHSLLNIPRESLNSETAKLSPSRDQIQEAFRKAAKRCHPDLSEMVKDCNRLGNSTFQLTAKEDANVAFRECIEARELLLDYYVRRKYVHPEIIQSTKDKPQESANESLFSVWTESKSFQLEVFLRLSICLGLAVGTYFHDKHMPERRRQQILRRDEQFYQFGPQSR